MHQFSYDLHACRSIIKQLVSSISKPTAKEYEYLTVTRVLLQEVYIVVYVKCQNYIFLNEFARIIIIWRDSSISVGRSNAQGSEDPIIKILMDAQQLSCTRYYLNTIFQTRRQVYDHRSVTVVLRTLNGHTCMDMVQFCYGISGRLLSFFMVVFGQETKQNRMIMFQFLEMR